MKQETLIGDAWIRINLGAGNTAVILRIAAFGN